MHAKLVEECPSCSSVQPATEKNSATVLTHWPIQIKLIGTVAPFLQDADLLVAADCTAFSIQGFQEKFLEGKKLLIGCPKLDDGMSYVNKFAEIFSTMFIKSVSCLRMEVPCCGGMTMILKEAIRKSRKNIPLKETIIGVKGAVLGERDVEI